MLLLLLSEAMGYSYVSSELVACFMRTCIGFAPNAIGCEGALAAYVVAVLRPCTMPSPMRAMMTRGVMDCNPSQKRTSRLLRARERTVIWARQYMAAAAALSWPVTSKQNDMRVAPANMPPDSRIVYIVARYVNLPCLS